MSAITKAPSVALQTYRALENRITKSDLDGVLARWEFGGKLLAERRENGGKQLPNGRIEQVCNALQTSSRELRFRMQFAEEYDTPTRAQAAFKRFGSWYAICAQGLGDRELSPALTPILSPSFVPEVGSGSRLPTFSGPLTRDIPDAFRKSPYDIAVKELIDEIQILRARASKFHEVDEKMSPEAMRFIAKLTDDYIATLTQWSDALKQKGKVR